MSDSDVYAEFTEDKPIKCGRLECRRTILPDEPRHIINNARLNGKGKTNISEGKTIPANSTPPSIINLAMEVLKPRLLASTRGFEWDWTQFIIREVNTWTDLAGESVHQPYFYERCLANPTGKNNKDKGKVFKKPRNPFFIALVIDTNQYHRYLDFEAKHDLEEEERVNRATSSSSSSQHFHNDRDSFAQSTTSTTRPRVSTASWNDYDVDNLNQEDPDNQYGSGSTWRTFSTDKRPRSNTSVTEPRTPPPAKKRNVYTSPDQAKLRQALAVGGSSEVSAATPPTSERVEFFPIKGCRLDKLLQSTDSGGVQYFTCESRNASQGSLTVECSTSIGVGTFKTAHTAYLTLVHLHTRGLGTVENDCVVAKRMYRSRNPKPGNNGGWVVRRFQPPDEYAKTLQEANLLFWGSSIMAFTFHSSTMSSPRLRSSPPSISHGYALFMLELRFRMSRSYLVEEFIDTDTQEFVKYIHNGDAVPLLSHEDPYYDIADFLCFTQHVQYFKSGGAVFLSDYQGSQTLLTDPQIMTSPDIAKGTDIFGEGNVGTIFLKFPEQHVCNAYCKWFKLPLLKQSEEQA
ncbi:hypothetical protein DFH06DRAFT_1125517 [Mycena polygramma]|nr:hypothetical protein DFH06DRAFT_1125517 [Mycena polygramma]